MKASIMSIGNIGKRAQQNGQSQKSRYQVNYQTPANTPLLPPRRPESANHQTEDAEIEPNIIIDPPAAEASLQREVEIGEVSSEAGQTNNEQASSAPEISPKVVADKVFEMLKRDMRLERERRGKSRF